MKVKYIGCSNDQYTYGGGSDPRGLLVEGDEYEVEQIYMGAWRTSYSLRGHEGAFNSVSFEIVAESQDSKDRSLQGQLRRLVTVMSAITGAIVGACVGLAIPLLCIQWDKLPNTPPKPTQGQIINKHTEQAYYVTIDHNGQEKQLKLEEWQWAECEIGDWCGEEVE